MVLWPFLFDIYPSGIIFLVDWNLELQFSTAVSLIYPPEILTWSHYYKIIRLWEGHSIFVPHYLSLCWDIWIWSFFVGWIFQYVFPLFTTKSPHLLLKVMLATSRRGLIKSQFEVSFFSMTMLFSVWYSHPGSTIYAEVIGKDETFHVFFRSKMDSFLVPTLSLQFLFQHLGDVEFPACQCSLPCLWWLASYCHNFTDAAARCGTSVYVRA